MKVCDIKKNVFYISQKKCRLRIAASKSFCDKQHRKCINQ